MTFPPHTGSRVKNTGQRRRQSRCRCPLRGGSAIREETEEPEAAIPLEESMSNYWGLGVPLEGYSVSIRPSAIEMPLLKRLGTANLVSEPGLETYLRAAYQTISQQAVQVAFRDVSEEK